MDKDTSYQGWTNAQTWCVAGFIDNDRELLPKAIDIGRHYMGNKHAARMMLKDLVLLRRFDVFTFADWVWKRETINAVNWDELLKHYYGKWKEQIHG